MGTPSDMDRRRFLLGTGALGTATLLGGGALVLPGGEYQGPESELVRLIDPFLEAGGAPSSHSVRSGEFIDGLLFWGRCRGYSDDECHIGGSEPGQRPEGLIGREAYARYAQFLDRAIGDDGFAVVARWVEERADDTAAGNGLLFAEPLGGAYNRVRPEATAFVHRSSLYWAEVEATWDPAADQDRIDRDVAWVRGFLDDLRPFSSGSVYQNFPDAELDDWLDAAYGTNLPRLQRVKRRWDPMGSSPSPAASPRLERTLLGTRLSPRPRPGPGAATTIRRRAARGNECETRGTP